MHILYLSRLSPRLIHTLPPSPTHPLQTKSQRIEHIDRANNICPLQQHVLTVHLFRHFIVSWRNAGTPLVNWPGIVHNQLVGIVGIQKGMRKKWMLVFKWGRGNMHIALLINLRNTREREGERKMRLDLRMVLFNLELLACVHLAWNYPYASLTLLMLPCFHLDPRRRV